MIKKKTLMVGLAFLGTYLVIEGVTGGIDQLIGPNLWVKIGAGVGLLLIAGRSLKLG